MRFKLDENLGTRTQQLFREAEHDVMTVWEESLWGSTDQTIHDVCCQEHRCLVTLDLDFANVVRFPPAQTAGIVVLRLPKNPNPALLEHLVRQFLQALKQESVSGQLWIVEMGWIRIHQQENSNKTEIEA
jgi:predicted nuclease of predicted toxin-antitoxin system